MITLLSLLPLMLINSFEYPGEHYYCGLETNTVLLTTRGYSNVVEDKRIYFSIHGLMF